MGAGYIDCLKPVTRIMKKSNHTFISVLLAALCGASSMSLAQPNDPQSVEPTPLDLAQIELMVSACTGQNLEISLEDISRAPAQTVVAFE